jgi:hypothetical protein
MVCDADTPKEFTQSFLVLGHSEDADANNATNATKRMR